MEQFIILGAMGIGALIVWYSCGLHGKSWAVWITIGIVVVTLPVGNGAILLGTLPGSPIIYLLVLGILNLLAKADMITLPRSKDPRDQFRGKPPLKILLWFVTRGRRG